MTDTIKNVFISHIHPDDHRLEPLKALLADNGVAARDSSITNDKQNRANNKIYIMRDILAPRIDWAGTMFVLITPETKDSEWVEREICYAVSQNKPVIGIWDEGHEGCEIPASLDDFGCAIVPWDAKLIISAAYGDQHQFLNPDGTPRGSREIPRANCG